MSLKLPLASSVVAVVLGLAVLSGCASKPTPAPAPVCSTDNCGQRAENTPVKLFAVGYGSTGSYTQYTHAQQRLMAMRAAQVDAYRNLAEQVYGFRLWGNTAVSAFASQSDSVRTHIDAFIRGARVVNMTAIADGNFEATVELVVSQNFVDCLSKQTSCDPHTVQSARN